MDLPRRTRQGRDKLAAGERFTFIGGHLALDFANTLGGRRGGSTRELLVTYADLIAWGLQASIIAPDEAERLVHAAQRDPSGAVLVFEQARRLREAIYALVVALMDGDAAPNADLAVLNGELAQALIHRRITTGSTGPVWTWDWRDDSVPGGRERHRRLALDAVLWPVAVAAGDLLTVRDHPPLRQCASDECSWLYLDTTRNHSRRWCDMKGCGNKAKVRRYRQRQT
ncbi:MAG TPA: ABATE domain-containing protein [Ktedonobacterales bacterium]|nr:ABATE domain-containing protein [Ktedonobacterales bacterium]